MHAQFELRHFETNGIEVRAAVAGSGPLVILVHGWPELWYSWRHQIGPLAEAGFRVVAPDVRGYGGSDRPHAVEAYTMKSLTADVVGLIDALGEERAILIGHDWGAPICWNTAALYPSRVAAVAGLSVPYRKRGPMSSIDLWRKLYAGRFFYQLYFQQEGVAEAELEADVGSALRKIYYSISGDAPSRELWGKKGPAATLLDGLPDPDPFPAWLSEDDIAYFTAAFEESGFRGPLNRYRCQRLDWEELPQLSDLTVDQPSLFVAGTRDLVRNFVPGMDLYEAADADCTDFRGKVLIEGVGHWVQQEAPRQVNEALLGFLQQLG